MREILNRIKKIKREEIGVPEAAEAAPVPEQIDTGRRWFMQGVAAVGATAIAAEALKPVEALAAKSDAERIRSVEADTERKLAAIRARLNTDEMRQLRVGLGRDPERVFAAMRGPFSAEELRGTKHDMSKMGREKCVQVAYERNGRGGAYIVSYNSEPPAFKSEETAIGYFNALYLENPEQLVMPQHGKYILEGKPVDIEKLGKHDLAFISNAPKARPEQVIIDDPSLNHWHIEQQLVTVEAIDPDRTSNGEKRKEYCSIALMMNRPFIDAIFTSTPESMRDRMARSFAIILPDGEAEGLTAKARPGTGTSGAPVFMRRGREVLAGELWCIVPVEVDGKIISVGFFNGIENIREARNEKIRTGA